MLRLALILFAAQAGYQAYTASMPLALARAGLPDPEIGFVVGVAAAVQIPAALLVGGLLDRFGGIRLLGVGMAAYMAGSAVLLLPGLDPARSLVPFAAARVLQGIGLGACLPSALSLVPRAVDLARLGLALAVVQSSNNLATIVVPTLSLIALDAAGLGAVAVLAIAIILGGVALLVAVRGMMRARVARTGHGAARLRLVFRRSWASPLAVVVLFVVQWGVLVAYLPQRAEAVGANVALFFIGDGVGIIVSRPITGWLTDRVPARRLIAAGLALTAVGLALLVQPATTPLMLVGGILVGLGGGLVNTPLLVELSRRSDDADRGSAFSLFTASHASAMAIGSIGAAPIVGAFGFPAAVAASMVALVLSGALAFADAPMALAPRRAAAA